MYDDPCVLDGRVDLRNADRGFTCTYFLDRLLHLIGVARKRNDVLRVCNSAVRHDLAIAELLLSKKKTCMSNPVICFGCNDVSRL